MEEKFADLGLQEALRRLYDGTPFKPFVPAAHIAMQEGVDFNLVYFPLKHLGHKAVTAVTGELYSQLRHPETLSVVLGVSSKLDYPQIEELWSGITAAAKEYGYKDTSLDLQPSENGLCISVAASGELHNLTNVSRPKPQSKDLLCVSGRLGAAYLGMRVMERELERFDKWNLPQRKKLGKALIKGLAGHPLIKYLPVDTKERENCFWLVPFVVDTTKFKDGITMKDFIKAVQVEGACAYSVLWPEMYKEEAFTGKKGFGSRHYPFGDPAHRKIDYTKFNCKVAHSLADSTISFWTHPTYTLEHIEADIKAFKKVAAAMMK